MIGQKIIYLSSVDSTNNYVAKLLDEGDIEHGTVILAENQTSGRGQRGTEWQSEPGMNLTFSVLLSQVNLSVDQQFVLTQMISVSMVRAMKEHGISASIKWPNDIFVGDHKLAGILIENRLKGNAIKESIIGVGLNVNQKEFEDIPATSMARITGHHYNLSEVLFSIIHEFNSMSPDQAFLIELSKEYLNDLLGYRQERTFKSRGQLFKGTIIGVNKIGQLQVISNGKQFEYNLKEIEFIF